MAAYEIGKRIREVRVKCSMTQEELAYGICSTGTLSRIENGVQTPSRRTFEALMQRLGEPEYLYSIHLNRDEMQSIKVLRQMERFMLRGKLNEVEQLFLQYKNYLNSTGVLEKQSFKVLEASLHEKQGMPPDQVINELVKALMLTWRDYDHTLPKIFKRLTFDEITILNNIAVQYTKMREYDKAFSYLKWIKEYFEIREFDEQERAKIYPVVLYNYGAMLMNQGRFQDAGESISLGIAICRDFGQLETLPYLLLSMGHVYMAWNDTGKAEKYFTQAECLFYLLEYYEAIEKLREINKEDPALLMCI